MELSDPNPHATAPDADLLARFASARDEAAFAELVRRHAPAVLGTCRRICGNSAEAEDAAQAVFLTLAKKAAALESTARASLAPWLHRVAVCVARDGLRAERARRHREQEAAAMPRDASDEDRRAAEFRDVLPLLDAAIEDLPEKYRAAVVLHHLQGHSHQAAAERLGCKPSAFSMRLTRARELLRENLARRGAVVSLSVLGTCLAQQAGSALAVPSAAFVAATAQAALAWTAGTATAGLAAGAVSTAGASPKAAALAQGALKMFFVEKLKFAAASGLAAMVAVAITAGVAMNLRAAEAPTTPEPKPAPAEARPADPNAAPAAPAAAQVAAAAEEALAATDSPGAAEALGTQGVLLVRDAARWKDLRDRMAKFGLAVKNKDLLEPDFSKHALVCVFKLCDEGCKFSVQNLRGDDRACTLGVAMSYIIYKSHMPTPPVWKALCVLVPRSPAWTVNVSTYHPMNGGGEDQTVDTARLEYTATFDNGRGGAPPDANKDKDEAPPFVFGRGDLVDGLCAALKPKATQVKAGDDILLEFHLEFRDGRQIKGSGVFAGKLDAACVWDGKYSNGYRNHAFMVETPGGKTVWLQRPVQDNWEKNVPHLVEVTAAKPYVLPEWYEGETYKSLKALGLDTTKPGKYRITGIYLESGSPAKDATAKDTWGGCIASSPIEIEVK